MKPNQEGGVTFQGSAEIELLRSTLENGRRLGVSNSLGDMVLSDMLSPRTVAALDCEDMPYELHTHPRVSEAIKGTAEQVQTKRMFGKGKKAAALLLENWPAEEFVSY